MRTTALDTTRPEVYLEQSIQESTKKFFGRQPLKNLLSTFLNTLSHLVLRQTSMREVFNKNSYKKVFFGKETSLKIFGRVSNALSGKQSIGLTL